MIRLREMVTAVAPRDCTVLVNGQSGTGKELVARSVHAQSRRAAGPFVAVDCTALRDTLLESQLFGHVKGAFTGADQPTLGFFRAAEGGTLFLDEIGEMDLKTQAKLLRSIQERAVVPLGAVKPIPVNVRVIVATHRDLRAMVDRGEFREDLYFRLDVVRLVLPPLSERGSDVRALADHFLFLIAELYQEPIRRFAPEVYNVLEAHTWPGNVRELANVVEHAVVFSGNEVIGVEDLPERLRGVLDQPVRAPLAATPAEAAAAADLPIITLAAAEKALISRALQATSGNQSAAANMLQIERRRLARKIERYGLRNLVNAHESPADNRELA
jgi:DNA-binding NtrC family response regulator